MIGAEYTLCLQRGLQQQHGFQSVPARSTPKPRFSQSVQVATVGSEFMKVRIKTLRFLVVALTLVVVSKATDVAAQGSIPKTLLAGCGKELKTYCSKVTPGEGRIVACLYARGDKVSPKCAFAIYDASAQLDAIMDALAYLAENTSCRSDINQYCANVPAGGGQLYRCVKKHKATLTNQCRAAIPKAEAMLKRAGIVTK